MFVLSVCAFIGNSVIWQWLDSKMCEPMITVIVPVYNTERYIGRCLDSILFHSRPDIEVVIVDDGSTDASGEICDQYAGRDHRVKVIHQVNLGVSAARNAGLEAANGEYVAFVDSDDALPENALEILLNANRELKYDLVFGDWKISWRNRQFANYRMERDEYSGADLCIEATMNGEVHYLMAVMVGSVCGKLFRNDVIRDGKLRFDTTLSSGEDSLFFIDYLPRIKRKIRNTKTVVYNCFRYDPSERISATSAFYYDFIYLIFAYCDKMFNLARNDVTEEHATFFYSHMLDGIITHLVRAFAYADCFGESELDHLLESVTNSEMIKTAIRKYRRGNPQFSLLIPLALRMRHPGFLKLCLKFRTRNYWRTHERECVVKSIYRRPRVNFAGVA